MNYRPLVECLPRRIDRSELVNAAMGVMAIVEDVEWLARQRPVASSARIIPLPEDAADFGKWLGDPR